MSEEYFLNLSLGKLLGLTGLYHQRRIAGRLVFAEDQLYSVWQEEHLRRLFDFLQVDCVFDVGANHGQFARMLREQIGYAGLIVSFEPLPELAAELQELAAHDANWQIEAVALAPEDGSSEFHVMAVSEFSSISTPRHDESGLFKSLNRVTRTIEVQCETLTTALRRLQLRHGFRRPFLKLDTQGMDTAIVRASADATRQFVGLQCELSIKKPYTHSVDFRSALESYEQCGFALATFLPINPGHFPQMVETDCLMVRRDLLENRGE